MLAALLRSSHRVQSRAIDGSHSVVHDRRTAEHRVDGVNSHPAHVDGQDDAHPVGPFLLDDHLEPLGQLRTQQLLERGLRLRDQLRPKRRIPFGSRNS